MTATFTLTIDTGNDAFSDNPCGEIARILRDLADRIDDGGPLSVGDSYPLWDYNGNRVGATTVTRKAR